MKTMIREQLDGLIDAFRARTWRGEPLRRAVRLDREEPGFLGQLLADVMVRAPMGGRFIDALLAVLPEESWPGLVAHAVERFSCDMEQQAALQILCQGILQHPVAVHPHLLQLFQLELRDENEFVWAFREASGRPIRFLFELCAEGDRSQRRLACRALLETRLPDALAFAQAHGKGFAAYLPAVGFEQTSGGFRKLYPDRVFHLAFPAPYLDRLPSEVTQRNLGLRHPTWAPIPGDAPIHSLGGASSTTCRSCGQRVPRLILLDPVPPGIGVTGLSRLELVACFGCLGWAHEVVHYQHAPDGTAEALPFDTWSIFLEASPPWEEAPAPEGRHGKPDPASTLAECAVSLVELDPRWRWQDWCTGLNLHRLGGHPNWIQGAAYPRCPGCGQTSAFLFQLDSDLWKGNGQLFHWGEGGLGYVFFCDRCKISSALWQCI
jgi:hypothetical protein